MRWGLLRWGTMLKKILFVLLGFVLLLVGYAAFQPAEYVISRQITINAPIEKIFPYLNNTKLAEQWGPWSEVDPQAKMTVSGPDEGVGAKSSWESTGQLGTGSATIVESVPNQLVRIKLEYVKPMNMTQDSRYILATVDDRSFVTWKVEGRNDFIGRIMCIFVNMDKMVGSMFEKGLLNLKTLVEKSNTAL